MRKNIVRSLCFAVMSACLLTGGFGCGTHAEVQDRVVEDAREYLLKNAPELTAEQRSFVRFNPPVFLVAPIIGTPEISEPPKGEFDAHMGERFPAANLSGEVNQVCVTWRIPGRKEWYMVYGHDTRALRYWSPIRLIRKEFGKYRAERTVALLKARVCAESNLYYVVDVATFNHLRFNDPEIRRSDFELVKLDRSGRNTEEEPLKPGEEQISFVWPVIGDAGRRIVVCGASDRRHVLMGWRALWVGEISADEVKKHSLALPVQMNEKAGELLPPGMRGRAAVKSAAKPQNDRTSTAPLRIGGGSGLGNTSK